MVSPDVDGGLVLAPESACIIQKTEGCIVAGVTHTVFHVVAEKQEEIRFFGIGVFIHGIETEPRHAVEVGSQEDFIVILFGIERLEGVDLPSHMMSRAVRGLIPVQCGEKTIFIFSAGLQVFEMDRVQILAEINGSVLDFPYGFEFFRTFFPILDPTCTGAACDPVDRNEILRRIQEPGTVHRGGQIILMAHIVCGSCILHGTGLHGPVVIMSVDGFGSISGKSQRCGGKKHHTEQMFLHLVSFLLGKAGTLFLIQIFLRSSFSRPVTVSSKSCIQAATGAGEVKSTPASLRMSITSLLSPDFRKPM